MGRGEEKVAVTIAGKKLDRINSIAKYIHNIMCVFESLLSLLKTFLSDDVQIWTMNRIRRCALNGKFNETCNKAC